MPADSAAEHDRAEAPALSAPELAREAADLDRRRDRLAEVRGRIDSAEAAHLAAVRAAGAAYSAAVGAATREREEALGPLVGERDDLVRAVDAAEKAAAALENRRLRVEQLRAQLAAAESELPN